LLKIRLRGPTYPAWVSAQPEASGIDAPSICIDVNKTQAYVEHTLAASESGRRGLHHPFT